MVIWECYSVLQTTWVESRATWLINIEDDQDFMVRVASGTLLPVKQKGELQVEDTSKLGTSVSNKCLVTRGENVVLEGHIHNGVYVVNAEEAFRLINERFGHFGKSKMK